MKNKLLLCLGFLCVLSLGAQQQQLFFNDADQDQVVIPSNPAYELGSESFTIEAVINASEMQSNTFPMIVSKRGNDAFSGFFLAMNRVSSNYYLFVQIDGLNYFAGQAHSIPLNDGQCHHVAAKRDGDTISIFVDGVMVKTAGVSSARTIDNDATIVIGEDEARNNETAFNGVIGEVRFWNTARSDADISDNSQETLSDTNLSDLIGYWRLNETGSGQVITDASSTSNNGVLGGLDIVEDNDPERIDGNCIVIPEELNQLLFSDSEKDRVVIPSNPAYELGSGSFTIEAVINASETQSNTFPMIVSKRGSDAFSGFFLAMNRVNSNYYLFVQIDGLNYFAEQAHSIPLNDGQCHHVAAKRDGDTISIFVDGVMVKTAGVSPARTIDNDAAIFIGEDEARNNATAFNGVIGEVRFWNTARSDADISDNSQETLSDTNQSDLIGYWRLNETGSGQVITDASSTSNNGVLGDTDAIEDTDPERIEDSCLNTVLSVGDFNQTEEFIVYPNPFTNSIMIAGDVQGIYRIFSITGRLVITGKITQGTPIIIPDSLTSGSYFIEIQDALTGRGSVTKLIKK